jgi:hypothetical protein
VTLALDAHESEGVLEAARAHRKAGALDHLCEANLMLVGMPQRPSIGRAA